jgi:glycosyltransferase involved in cell wall biosynthesis
MAQNKNPFEFGLNISNMTDNRSSVALFLPSLTVGGAERMMVNLARGLSDRGYDVDMVLVNAVGGFIERVPDSVRIVDLNASRVLNSLPGLIRYLRNSSPSVLLSTITPSNVIAAWATSFPGVTTRHVVRVARPESEAAKIQENTQKERITAILARYWYPRADHVVAISEGVADDLRQNTVISEENLSVIHNPVLTEDLQLQATESVDHPWFNAEIPVVLGVGRLVDQKDFSTLIRGFSILRENHHAKLVIYGDGEKREELENLVDDFNIINDVMLPGFTNNPYKYMANSDIFVNSAKHEGFGNVIIEAMACGCPVVATDCPGAPAELLGHGKYGRLSNIGDPESLAMEMEAMLENPINKSVLKKRADDFRLKTAMDSYTSVLFG